MVTFIFSPYFRILWMQITQAPFSNSLQLQCFCLSAEIIMFSFERSVDIWIFNPAVYQSVWLPTVTPPPPPPSSVQGFCHVSCCLIGILSCFFLSLSAAELSFRWILNEFPTFIPLDKRRFVSQITGNLYISKVDSSDSGNYSCITSSPSISKSVFSNYIPLVPLTERQYLASIFLLSLQLHFSLMCFHMHVVSIQYTVCCCLCSLFCITL